MKGLRNYFLYICIGVFLLPVSGYSQLTVSNTQSPQQLVENVLVGNGVNASNISYTGSTLSIGKFSNGSSTNIGLDEGVIISTGNIMSAIGPNIAPNKTANMLGGSDPQLAALVPGYSVFDAAAIEFDFIPMSDTLKLDYVFASDEYPEWVGSTYNDIFGFFVSGPNPNGGNYSNLKIATIPNTNLPVTVNNLNNGPFNTGPCTNCSFYVNNTNGLTIEYDGFTTVLRACLVVTPCVTYHIKIAVGDVGDHAYDSGIFLKSNSFSTNIVSASASYSNPQVNQCVEGCSDAIVSFKLTRPTTQSKTVRYTIGGSATMGQDYLPIPDSVVFAPLMDSVAIQISPILDSLIEPTENIVFIIETSSCSYDTLIVNLQDYHPISVEITGQDSICKNDSLQLNSTIFNGSQAYNLIWNDNSTNATNIFPADSSNLVWVNVTDLCGFTHTDSMTYTVIDLPQISLTTDKSIFCYGDSAMLTASGASSFSWWSQSILSSNQGDTIYTKPISNSTIYSTGTNIFGCISQDSVSIIVHPLPNISINASAIDLCPGDTATLIASGAQSYFWNSDSTIAQNFDSTIIVKPSATNTYYVKGFSIYGCVDSNQININVHNIPQLYFSPSNPEICLGQSVNLHVSGAQNYTWTPNNSLSSSSGNSTVSTANVNTLYQVHATDQWGCENADSILLIVNSLPSITVAPSDTLICHYTSAQINVSGATNYSWSPSSSLSSSTGSNVVANPVSTTIYTVIGTDSNGCSDTTYSKIYVAPIPAITATNQTICLGETSLIAVNPTLPGSNYLWSNGDSNSITQVSPSATTTYSVIVTDSNGCSGNAQATITVNPLPVLSISPASPTICYGGSVMISAYGAANYSWSPSIGLSSTAGNQIIVNPTSTTTYVLKGQNANGCIDSISFTINVNPLPSITSNAKDSMVCVGQPFVLNALGAATYSWSPSNYLSNTTGASVVSTPVNDINYIITGTDTNGCVNTDTVQLNVSPKLNIYTNPNSVCLGDTSVISVIANTPSNFIWSNGDTTSSFKASPNNSTNYTVTATDNYGCVNSKSIILSIDMPPVVSLSPVNPDLCSGSSLSLTATGANSYYWFPTTNLSGSGATVSVSPTVNTTYSVVGTNGKGCKDTAYTTINVIPSPVVSVTPTVDTFCLGGSSVLNASGAISYQWYPTTGLNSSTGSTVTASPTTTTNYRVTGTAANGCKSKVYSKITVNPLPNLSANPSSADLCYGQSVTISATGADSYQWSPSSTLSSSTANNVIASPLSSSTYKLIGTTAYGCVDSMQISVGVHPYPIVNINPSNVHLCPGSNLTIVASGADNYLWSPATGINSTTNDTLIASPALTTTYKVIGTTIYGCSDTASTQIEISPIPTITPQNSSICIGDSVQLTVTSNTSTSTFIWSTGATTATIWAKPNNTTTYTVTATDISGCSNTVSAQVVVNQLPNLVLSPANPGICPNDTATLNITGATSYQWNFASGLQNTIGSSNKAFPSSTSWYSVVGLSSAGCSDTLNFQVEVYNPPTISISPSIDTICNGQSISLIAQGTNFYNWSPAATLNSNNNDTVIASPSTLTNYRVIGSDFHGCTDTAYSKIYVYGLPIISATNSTICPGDSSILTVSTAIAPDSVLWNTGATTNSITVKPVNNTTYYVYAYYTNGCIQTTSQNMYVHSDPVVSASILVSHICPGDTAKLNGSNSLSYTWTTTTGNLLSNTGSDVKAIPSQNALYFVEGTSIHGCKSLDSISVSLFNAPVIQASSADSLICKNDTVSLFSTGGINYNWSPSNTLNINNSNHVIANPSFSTSYEVIGIDINGCSSKDSVFIIVDHGPNVSITSSVLTVCQGDTAILTGNGAISYQWTPSIWMSSNTGSLVKIYPNSNITYYLTGFNSNGCSNTTSIYINVKRNPVMWVSPQMDSICQGDSIQIIATGAGGNGIYSWSPGNGLSLVIGDTIWAKPASNTTYQITGTSTDGCSKTTTSNIKVNPKPTVQISSSSNQVCLNDTVQLISSGATTYSWNANNISLQNTGNLLSLHPIFTTIFTAIGTNNYGCTDSAHKQIQVNNLPSLTLSATDTVLCNGDSTALTITGGSAYNWFNSSILNQSTGNYVIAHPLLNSIIIVEATDTNGCKNTDSLEITVNPRPSVTLSASKTHICAGDSIQLTALSNMNPMQYFFNSGDTTAVILKNPNLSTKYTVTGINEFGCDDSVSVSIQVNQHPILSLNLPDTTICIYDSLQLTASSNKNPVNFQWNNSAITPQILVSPQFSTSYSVIASDSIGCSDTANINLGVQSLPTLSLSSSKPHSCAGENIVISASTNSGKYYLWNNSMVSPSLSVQPNNPTIYSVTVTDSIGCKSHDSIYQIVNPIPQITIMPTAPQICFGDSFNLIASSTVNPVNFLWNTNQTTSSITTIPQSSTTYSLTVTDSIGCSSNASRAIVVNSLPILDIQPNNSEICRGDSIVLSVGSMPAIVTAQWSTGQTTPDINISPISSTNYSVTITDIHNCQNTINQNVVVYDNPTVSVSAKSKTICSGDTIQISASSNHPIQNILWSSGQSSSTISITPLLSSCYKATVIDTNGCLGADSAYVNVIHRPLVNITADESVICSFDSTIIRYTGTATNGALYTWNFDKANVISGNGNSPHTVKWNKSGTYYVWLTATENGCTSYPDSAEITVNQTPVIEFTGGPTESCESLLVIFQNLTPNLKLFAWDFGNPLDMKDTSSVENPTYAYPYEGSYTVGLYGVSVEGCPAYGYKANFINVHKNPLASFNGFPNKVSILNPNISFWDFSEDAIQWSYDFDDPNSGTANYSNEQYPWHSFTDTGYFHVQLVVMNNYGCSDTTWQDMYIKPFPQLYFANSFTPNGDGLNEEFVIKGHDYNWQSFEIIIFDRWGKAVFQSNDINYSWNGKVFNNGDHCPAGNYVFIIYIKDKESVPETFKGNIILLK